jgi:hypothetical protein
LRSNRQWIRVGEYKDWGEKGAGEGGEGAEGDVEVKEGAAGGESQAGAGGAAAGGGHTEL